MHNLRRDVLEMSNKKQMLERIVLGKTKTNLIGHARCEDCCLDGVYGQRGTMCRAVCTPGYNYQLEKEEVVNGK